jgi:hypothetical protein
VRADEDFLDIHELNNCIAELQAASQSLDHGRARQILLEVVREYSPTNGIDDLVWLKKTSDRIVDFPKKPT